MSKGEVSVSEEIVTILMWKWYKTPINRGVGVLLTPERFVLLISLLFMEVFINGFGFQNR